MTDAIFFRQLLPQIALYLPAQCQVQGFQDAKLNALV